MNSPEIPDSCPFCGSVVSVLADGKPCRAADGAWVAFECLTSIHRGHDTRACQSRPCEDAERQRLTTEVQALRTANAGLVEKVKRLAEAGDGLRTASRVFLLSFVDDDYGADDGTPINRVDPDASVQWEDPPTAGEHVQLQNAINKWNQAKGQP